MIPPLRMAHRPPRYFRLQRPVPLLLVAAVVLTFGTLLLPAGSRANRATLWWSRSFERPEVLPAAYPFCCGTYWDMLLLSATSSGMIVADPTNPRNHVFAAHTGPNNGHDYADWSLLTQNSEKSHGTEATSVWVRLRFYLPPHFKPTGYTAGQVDSAWNWLTEFHEAGAWSSQCAGENPGSVALGVLNRRTRRGVPNPRFFLQLVGGSQSTSNCIPQTKRIDGPRIRRAHWYSLVEHVIFSPSENGLLQIWLDGRRMASTHFPTVYRHPNGIIGRYYFCFGYYRLRSSWDATVLFDNVAEGPTRASTATRSGRHPR
jgi:hypothetical protein